METLITELTTALPDEESLTQESQEDLDDLPMTVHIDNRDAAEYPKEEEATQPQPSEEPQTSLETELVPEPKPVPKSEPVPEPKPVPKQEEAARPEKEQERDAKKEKGKRGKILPIAVIGAVAVIILVIILCVAGKGNKSKTPDTPTMKQVMNDVIADDAISDTILEFEVVESKLNQQGTTYTVNCSAKTEKEEYTVIVIYELEDDDWVYSQNIVKSSE
jgi:hypothetical protein